MKIKGEYRDVISRNGVPVADSGWKSNTIVADFGKLLAAVMKKEYKDGNSPVGVGIEYIAVGSKRSDYGALKERTRAFFNKVNTTPGDAGKPLFDAEGDSRWVWAKRIEDAQITYVTAADGPSSEVTNKIKIEIVFGANEPDSSQALEFEDFSLVGIFKASAGFDTALERMFFVNYVTHGAITKEPDMTLNRTIKLTFPI